MKTRGQRAAFGRHFILITAKLEVLFSIFHHGLQTDAFPKSPLEQEGSLYRNTGKEWIGACNAQRGKK